MPPTEVTREVFWKMSGFEKKLFFGLAFLATAIFVWGVVVHVRRVWSGRKGSGLRKGWVKELSAPLLNLLAQRKVMQRSVFAGLMHGIVFWGFGVLFIGTLIVALEYDVFNTLLGIDHAFWYGTFYLLFELALDLFGSLFVIGLSVFLVRRWMVKANPLKRQRSDLVLPVGLLVVGVSGFLLEASRLSAQSGQLTYNPLWSPVGHLFSGLIPASPVLHKVLWWFHGAVSLAWIAAVPFAPKSFHVLASAANTALRSHRTEGRLEKLDVEGAFEREETLGAEKVADLTRKDLLDVLSCTECGRCDAHCPATLSGKSLRPRDVVLNLQAQLKAEIPFCGRRPEAQPILGRSVTTEELWACTSCKACADVCPVYIEPFTKLLEVRRNEVMMHDRFPESFGDVLTGVERRSNPWNQHPSTRLDWAKGLEVPTLASLKDKGVRPEYLFFVGCSAAFDPRNQKIARSMVRILNSCKVSYGVLGEEEGCTGDFLRRIGNEHLFQTQCRSNLETFGKYAFEKILTLCPHCHHTFKTDYPQFGKAYPVVHHSQLIARLVAEGKIQLPEAFSRKVAYHDPCYLGRYNGVYDEPRAVLEKVKGAEIVEMERSREGSMCCGAGGGLMWLEEDPDKRVNCVRIKQAEEALLPAKDGVPAVIAAACPFCMTMLEDGLADRKEKLQCMDVAEIVAHAMGLGE